MPNITNKKPNSLVSWKVKTVIVTFVMFALILYFFLSKQRAGSVTIGINSVAIASAPIFVGYDSGYLEDANLKVSKISFVTGKNALDALLAKSVDVATVADVPIVNSSNLELRIILPITESPIRIVARRSKVKTIADLKNKRIGRPDNTSAAYFLERELEKVNLHTSDVVIRPFAPSDAVAALVNQDVDAISIWEPFAQRAIDELKENAVFFEDNDKDAYVEHFTLVTRKAVLDNSTKREALKRLIQGTIRATRNLRDNSTPNTALVAKNVGLSDRDINAVWDRFCFVAVPDDEHCKPRSPTEQSTDEQKIDKYSSDLLETLRKISRWREGLNQPHPAESNLRNLIEFTLWKEAVRSLKPAK